MHTMRPVRRVVLKGGDVELVVSPDLKEGVRFDEAQMAAVRQGETEAEAVFEGYRGQIHLPESGGITLVADGARVTGTFSNGEIRSGDLDLCVLPPAGAAAARPSARIDRVLTVLKDLVGIAGSVAVFWMLFKALPASVDTSEWIYWQVVLGAGAYYGFSGRWFTPCLVALVALTVYVLSGDLQSWRTYAYTVIKIAVFLATMRGGKWLRDGVDRFRRDGYQGLRNRRGHGA